MREVWLGALSAVPLAAGYPANRLLDLGTDDRKLELLELIVRPMAYVLAVRVGPCSFSSSDHFPTNATERLDGRICAAGRWLRFPEQGSLADEHCADLGGQMRHLARSSNTDVALTDRVRRARFLQMQTRPRARVLRQFVLLLESRKEVGKRTSEISLDSVGRAEIVHEREQCLVVVETQVI